MQDHMKSEDAINKALENDKINSKPAHKVPKTSHKRASLIK